MRFTSKKYRPEPIGAASGPTSTDAVIGFEPSLAARNWFEPMYSATSTVQVERCELALAGVRRREVLRAAARPSHFPDLRGFDSRAQPIRQRQRESLSAHADPAVFPAQLSVEKIHRRRPDEAGHEQVARLGVDLAGRTDLLHHALVHDDDAIGHGHGLDLVVGHVDHGAFELAGAGARARCACSSAASRPGSTAARRTGSSRRRARSSGPSPRAGAARRTDPGACDAGSR